MVGRIGEARRPDHGRPGHVACGIVGDVAGGPSERQRATAPGAKDEHVAHSTSPSPVLPCICARSPAFRQVVSVALLRTANNIG